MAGKQTVDLIQLGNSGTPANNFVIKTLNDGTMKIQRGNDGGALTDVLTIDANGKMLSAFDTAAGQLSLAASGYAKLANGLILQWGKANAIGIGAGTTVTLPIAFPNACFNVEATFADYVGNTVSGTTDSIFASIVSSSQILIKRGGSDALNAFWYALGY